MKLELTNQQIYDTVVTHLWAQNARSVSDTGYSCRYYNKATGNKCAVGCLIPPELYSWELEGRGIRDLTYCNESECVTVAGFLGIRESNTRASLLAELQVFHDRIFLPLPAIDADLLRMIISLTEIADSLGLSTEILTTTFRTNRPASPTTAN